MSWSRFPVYMWSSSGCPDSCPDDCVDREHELLHLWVSGEADERFTPEPSFDTETWKVKMEMPLATFDVLAVMRVAELIEEGQMATAVDRALEENAGNVGCDALCHLRDVPDFIERCKAAMT